MKSTELHPTTVKLAAVRWGSFDLRFEGTNTAGAWTGVTLRIDWALWPLIAADAALAWVTEKAKRSDEIANIEATLPGNVMGTAQAMHDDEMKRRAG